MQNKSPKTPFVAVAFQSEIFENEMYLLWMLFDPKRVTKATFSLH